MKPYNLLAALLLVSSSLFAENAKTNAWSENDELTFNLSIIEAPSNDLQKTKLKLTATNTGTNSIVMDKQLVVGIGLRFETDLKSGPTSSRDRDVSFGDTRKVDPPTSQETASRFVTLKPGDSLSRILDLSEPLQIVQEGHASDMNMAHYGFYNEATALCRIPDAAQMFSLTIWYERGVWMMAEPQFKDWFGKSKEDINLWTGRARSNTLTVTKK